VNQVRFMVEVWVDEDSAAYVAVARAMHIDGAEAAARDGDPATAAKQAIDQLIDDQAR
jgi:hypothetical protein